MPRSQPRADAAYRPRYYYRRDLTARELLPAIGAGVGAGIAIFWLARLFLQRTPLEVSPVRLTDDHASHRLPG